MFFKNLKFAFRNLHRDKFYTILNGIGLMVGMTMTLLIFMWIQDELSYDNYHTQNGQNYIVLSNTEFGGERRWGIRTPAPMMSAIKEQVPEIQHVARTSGLWKPVLKHENFLLEVENTFLVDVEFLKILDFEFVKGNPESALTNPNSIVLTETNAFKIFGNENPMGKMLRLDDKLDLEVTGIIKDTPINTHLPVDCLVPFDKNITTYMREGSLQWRAYNFSTYLTLRPEVDPIEVGKKLTSLPPDIESQSEDDRAYFELHPVRDIYLGLEKIEYGFQKGDWTTIKAFGWIGLIILLIASINYMNLTTARAAHRAKATSVRKIVGASRSHLIGQHLLEAFALIGICSLGALALAQISMPYFKEISGKAFSVQTILAPKPLFLIGVIVFVTILLSAVQPAFQLSAFRPVQFLKGNNFQGVGRKSSLRKLLVVAQFVSSAVLIICTIFMIRQMNFVQAAKLGYDKEHIFTFTHNHDNPQLILESLKGQPGIEEVTMSSQSIVSSNNQLGGFTWEGVEGEQDLPIYNLYAGDEFKNFFELELLEGRWFMPGKLDSASYVINEAAARAMKLENPVGKWMDFWGTRGTIVGVVKDFHFQSFHNEIQQLIFLQSTNWFPTMYVKTSGKNAAQAIASAEQIFKQHLPEAIFEYEFLDESYNKLYEKESRSGKVFLLFAFIAIIISCLGIFGLATYTAERRFKEIGVRKVLGASVGSIVHLLSKDFLQLVFLALVIAAPIAWYFMNSWLENFAYHINLDWWVFALAGVLAIGIAFITVSFQSVKAALTNPVESLKNE